MSLGTNDAAARSFAMKLEPMAEAKNMTSLSDQPAAAAQQRKARLLIIDDNPNYAKLFELLSDTLGITTHIVSSCAEGIEALKEGQFDMILMDWCMPDVDGVCCTGKIRELQLGTGQRTPIMGVSGYTSATREKSLEAGMDDFLLVPFTLEELHEKLNCWLNPSNNKLST